MFCQYCGREIPDESRFCGKCGARIDIQEPLNYEAAVAGAGAGTEMPSPAPSEEPKEKKRPFIAISVAFIIAAVIAILILILVLSGVLDISSDEEGKAADEPEIYYTQTLTYVTDSSGAGVQFSESDYSDGVLSFTETDYDTFYSFIDPSYELSYTFNLSYAEFNSDGHLFDAGQYYTIDNIDYEIKTYIEYETYVNIGDKVTDAYVTNCETLYDIDTGEEYYYELYIDIDLEYNEDDYLLEGAYAYFSSEDLDPGEYPEELYFCFSESEYESVMAIIYGGYECEVSYEFDEDGNLILISCDGSMESAADYAADILIYSGGDAADFYDPHLAQLLEYGGYVSYEYNEEGDIVCIEIEYGEDAFYLLTYEYEYVYDTDGNLAEKIMHEEDTDYYIHTIYEY